MTLYRLHEADLEIPDAWQDQSINIFKLPASGPAREASFVISRDASQGDAPFADYVARQLENADKQLPGFKLHKRWDINIHGHAAVLLDYQWQREGRDLMLRQVFIERRPAVLITTLTTTPADLPHHEPAWKQAMQPLVPRPTPSCSEYRRMDAQAAARLGDEIAHGFGVAAMVAGAVAGALIGAAVVAATAATGGLAAVILAGSIAAGGLSMFQIVKGLTTIFELPEPTTGVLIRGSFNVYVNSRNAMRAGDDVSATCSGLPLNHPLWPFPVLIAEGSATVYINGKPAARLQSKMVCGAHIKTGSQDTFIGGPTERVAFVLDLEEWLHTGLEALGLAALAGGLLLAAMAGVAALAGFVAIGGLMMGGMALLGDLGDRLGPGYRDLFQGVAGMALLGFGPKLAGRRPAAVTSETAQRRAYLNNKFGRSGNLDHDINYRGNRETAAKFFKSKDIDPADAESYMNGLDFNHPVRVETLAPGKNLWQYQSPGAPQGNWYTLSPRVQPTELGINPMGTNRAANTIEPKVLNSYRTTQKVEVLRSTAAPTDDFWSVKGQSYPAKGGAQQLFSNEKGSFGLLPREGS